MVWQPINLTEVCSTQSSATMCSNFGYVYLSLLVRLYGGSVDQRKRKECHKDAERKKRDGREYDFIVVGAGAAGCVVANRLSKNPNWKVLLLEAGSDEPDITSVPSFDLTLMGSSIDWQYTIEPNGKSCLAHPGGKCSLPRGKSMGGTSAIDGMTYARGNEADYDGWARMGNKGWSYKEVLPLFKKSERNLNIEFLDKKYHGTKGEQYVSWYPYVDEPSIMLTKSYLERGIELTDFNGARQEGTMQAQTTSNRGERVSTNAAFIRPIRDRRPNLYIEINAEARKILIDKYKNAYGIIYFKNDREYRAYARKEVIVSGGTINSPKLLMLSGIGPKEHLKSSNIPVVQDLPVGKNLHDHVTFNGLIVALSNESATSVTEEEILRAVKDYAKMESKTGPMSTTGPACSIAFFKTESDLVAPNIQLTASPIPNFEKYMKDPIKVSVDSALPLGFYDAMVMQPINIAPFSRGEVSLNRTHPNASPLIFTNYLGDDRDLKAMLKAARFLYSLNDTRAFRSHGAYFTPEKLPRCRHFVSKSDKYLNCVAKYYTNSGYHPVGTCKMGPERDGTAVVDSELRVYGVGSLRVIDASVMPIIVHANPVVTTIMIGEKGAEFIIKYWRCRTKKYF